MADQLKFYIVMFKDPRLPEYINKVQCVPGLWVTSSDEPGLVNVSHPSCEVDFDLIIQKANEFPSVNWSFYKATILHETSNKNDAKEKLGLLYEIQSLPKNTELDDDDKANEDEIRKKLILLKDIDGDSKQMNFVSPGTNIVELMPDSSVYIQNIRLHYIEKLKAPKEVIVTLLKAIFKEIALQTLRIDQLNQKGLVVLYVYMLLRYGINLEETREEVMKYLKANRIQNYAKKARF